MRACLLLTIRICYPFTHHFSLLAGRANRTFRTGLALLSQLTLLAGDADLSSVALLTGPTGSTDTARRTRVSRQPRLSLLSQHAGRTRLSLQTQVAASGTGSNPCSFNRSAETLRKSENNSNKTHC